MAEKGPKEKTEAKPPARKPTAKLVKPAKPVMPTKLVQPVEKDQPDAAAVPVAVAKVAQRPVSGSGSSMLKVKLVKSPIGYPQRQRLALAGLGLRRMQQIVERKDTPAIRGLVNKVRHLVEILA